MTADDVRRAALEWHAAGFAVLPVVENGKKRPDLDQWSRYQQEQPTVRQIGRWYDGTGRTGVGLVMGAISGNVEMFELEGRAVAEGARDRIVPALKAAGVHAVWQRLVAGYTEHSPSGGIHFIYRLDGHDVPGNTKVASRPKREEELTDEDRELLKRYPNKVIPYVLAETRGEGGFVVIAPSHGATHDSGKPWLVSRNSEAGKLANLSWDERVAVFGAIHSVLDEMPEPEPIAPRVPVQPTSDGSERPGDAYARATPWADILQPHGWRLIYRRGDMDFWRRPGEDKRIGWSARTGGTHDGLWVWSTSTVFPTEQSISKFRAYSILEHNGVDRDAAAQLRRDGYGGRQERQPATQRAHTTVQIDEREPPTESERPRGLSLPNLPPEFWDRREFLSKVRDAAYSLGCSADATLGAVLARAAGMVHHDLQFDFGLGPGSLNIFAALVSESGIGKTSAKKAATRLILPPAFLTANPDAFRDAVPMGSGEGIAELFMGDLDVETGEFHKRTTTKANKGDPVVRTVRGQVRHNVFMYVDEGETISKLMDERQGSTLGPALRSAWMGETIGQSNARAESTRQIPAWSYSLGVLVGYQPSVAQALLSDGGPGTPQRFLWLSAYDRNVPLKKLQSPAPFVLPVNDRNGDPLRGIIRAYPAMEEELWLSHVLKVRGEASVDTLNSHKSLMTCKLSAWFAAYEGRMTINPEDSELAATLWETSAGVRDALVAFGATEQQREQEARTAAYVDREVRTHAAKLSVAGDIERCATWIGRRIHEKGPATRGATKGAMAGRDKAYFDQALDRAVVMRWVELKHDDRQIVPGSARPA